MKTKTILLILFIATVNKLFAQQIAINSEFGLNRTSFSIGYEQSKGKWLFAVNGGFGQYGKVKLDESSNDGYSNIYQIFYPGYFKRSGFKHNFKGYSFSLIAKREIWSNEKWKARFGLGFSYYLMKDFYEYYYSVSLNEKDVQVDEHKIKQNALSLDLNLDLERKLTDNLSVRFGFFTPWYALQNTNKSIEYVPLEKKLPLSGFEPNLTLSVIYNFKKNEE